MERKRSGDDSYGGDVEELPDVEVGLGVGDGELHLCRGGRSTWNVGVMFIESAAKTRKRQEVGTKVSVHCIRIPFLMRCGF